MSRARALLHALMFGNVVVVCAAVVRLGSGRFDFDAENLAGFSVMAAAPAVSAQAATALRWHRIEQRAAAQRSGWSAGIAIALLSHLLFAVLGTVLALFLDLPGGHLPAAIAGAFVFLFLGSLALGGVLSLPLSALAAQWAVAQRAKELVHAAA